MIINDNVFLIERSDKIFMTTVNDSKSFDLFYILFIVLLFFNVKQIFFIFVFNVKSFYSD